MGRVDLYLVLTGRAREDRMVDRVYCVRGLEEDSEILRALWTAWYGKEYSLEHYPSLVRGIHYNLRWESVRELECIFRNRGIQAQPISGNSARRRPVEAGRQCADQFYHRSRGDGHEREVQTVLYFPSRCHAFYWLEPTSEDFGCEVGDYPTAG